MIDSPTQQAIQTFLAKYDSLVVATESEGQPFVTRAFYVESPLSETTLTLYGTFITTSRKLANLRQNARAGIFIGPDQPSVWLEATAMAEILEDEQKTNHIREKLGNKSPTAANFIARVPTVAVAFHINWLRITNLTGGPLYTEATFPIPGEDAGHE